MNVENQGVAPSTRGRSAALRAEPATQSQAKPAATNAAHTPLPWALSYGFSLPEIHKSATYVAPSSVDSVGIKLATPWIEGAWDDDEEAAANAEFIVRACNAHYDLVEALERAASWFEEYAEEHYRKARNAPDGREQHGREVKGKANRERAAELRAALASVDTRPKDEDPAQTGASLASGAVAAKPTDAQTNPA